jgi:hypothetical protein
MTRSVTIIENGRDGAVRYTENGRTINGYWEFGGGDVITIVSMGSREEWAKSHGWASASRASILRFVADETIRQRAPTCVADIDAETGVILLRTGTGKAPVAPAPDANQAKAAAFVRKYADVRSTVALIVLAVAALAGGVMWLGTKTLTVAQGHGVPLNECRRFDDPGGVTCLIQKTDPHAPNWSGRGGGETASVALLIVPFDGIPSRLVPVASGLEPSSFSLARVMGSDGQTIWVDVAGLYGVRWAGDRLVTPQDLQAANPTLEPNWWEDQRNMDVVDGRLHVMRRDRSAALNVDPTTLAASPTAPKPPKGFQHRADPTDFLVAAKIADTGYRNPAYVRLSAQGKPLQLAEPKGVLMVHTSPDGPAGTLLVSRMDDGGRALWTAETGLDRVTLQQVLPGREVVAFVGTRPPVPGKLSEPMVVLVEIGTGTTASHSLWR